MRNRALSGLIADFIVYRLLVWIRRRAERQGMLEHALAVPMNDLIGQRLIATGSYELTQIDALDQILANALPLVGFNPNLAGIFVDVGANIGVYTTRYSAAFANTRAIEPNPATFHILKANVALARASNVVTLSTACSDHPGTAPLAVPTDGMLGWSRLGSGGHWRSYAVDVPVDTLDSLVLKAGLKQRVALLKIDVEGYEPKVVRGASRTLIDDGPIVLYEVLDSQSARECAECLRATGYNHFVTFSRPLTVARAVHGLSVVATMVEPSGVERACLVCAFRR